MNRLYPVYALSGLISLGYQVVWFRLYADRFGSTNLSFLVVLCSFIAGLGFGALASRAVGDRVGRWTGAGAGLRCYGWVEALTAVAVALTVVAVLVPAEVWGPFPYRLVDGIYRPTTGYALGQVAAAVVCVFVPSFLMGVTFPLLCRVCAADERFPSRLYAWNTAGACIGVLLCHLVLIPAVGHAWTLAALVVVNAAIGVYFIAWDHGMGAAVASPSPSPEPARARADPTVLVVLGATGGLLTGALEGDLFKRLWFLGVSSGSAMVFISFWAIVAIFAASATVARVRGLRLAHLKAACALAVIVYWALGRHAYAVRDALVAGFQTLVAAPRSPVDPDPADAIAVLTDPLFTFAFTGVFAFPAVYLAALLLPYVCNRAQGDERTLDLAYGANTLAFCAGMVAFAWLAPAVSVFYSMTLVVAVLAAGVVALASQAEERPLRVPGIALAVAVLALAAVLTPPGFDRDRLEPGSKAHRYPVRALKSNGAHTTYVVALPEGDALYFDSHPMSGTSPGSVRYMRLMAHFPLLAQDAPATALLIGFGVGNTASAIAAHASIERIDIVDLNHRVIETAPEFVATNARVHEDPRVRFVHDDGRSFLARTDARYDLVTSEPPPPIQDGVYRLYSREYYEAALARLTAQGMLSQWVPTDQLSRRAVALIVGTFVEVFPHALLFTGHGRQLILVGSRAPFGAQRMVDRFEADPRVAADLARLGVDSPVELLARIVQGDGGLRGGFAHAGAISDLRNDLAYLRADPLGAAALAYAPRAVLDGLGLRPAPRAALESLLLAPERLHYRVPDFPFRWLTLAPRDTHAAVATDWRRLDALAAAHAGARDEAQRLAISESMVAIAPRHPGVLLNHAGHLLRGDRHGEALDVIGRFRTIEPGDTAGLIAEASARLGLGEPAAALSLVDGALRRGADGATIRVVRARALAASDRPIDALAEFERALEFDPDRVDALTGKSALMERLRGAAASRP